VSSLFFEFSVIRFLKRDPLQIKQPTERNPMPEPQNFKNHTRFDPPWHFFIAPAFLANLIFAIAVTIHHWPDHRILLLWWVFMSLIALFAVGKARAHSIVAQDRVIRLEERLRFAALLPADELARAQSLSVKQIIALRFASDAELPALVKRTLAENLEPKQIKAAIENWRPDYLRV
jgi:hypothetical protein